MQPWNPDSGISYKDWEKDYNRITYGDERGFEHGDRGKNYQNPGSLDKRIEDLFSRLPTSTGWPEGGTTLGPDYEGTYKRTPDPEAPGRTNPEDYIMDGPAPDPSLIPTDSWPTSLPRGRTNQAPRPEGMQRVATGIADWLTGNKWDFDQRGGSGIPRGRGQYYPRVLATTTTGDNNPNRIPLPLPADHERGTPVPLPLPEVPGNAVTRGLPTGPKPSGMSWDDWYGQHGLKTLLGRHEFDWNGTQAWNKGGEGVQYRM